MQHHLRRGGLALVALAVTTSLVSPTTPATAEPVPPATGSTWLLKQVPDGIVHNDQYAFDDFGLTVDVALALAGVNGNQDAVRGIADALEPNIPAYVTGGEWAPDDRYAGATAKTVVLAQVAGLDPAAYGADDLVDRLETLTADAAPIAGRIEDVSAFGDYSNSIGQSFAVRALTRAGSPEAAAATEFLLDQQCTPGYFRLLLTADKSASGQGCVDGDSTGSPADLDATALSALNLIGSGSDAPEVETALASAVTWLLAQQKADGSFGGGPSTEASNTNSTGLAGWVLGLLGETDAAREAAVWVRRHQAVSNGRCTDALTGEQGAIAYDGASLAAGRADGVTTETRDQWRRATAQAMPVLRWAPGATGPRSVTGPTGFVPAGSVQTLTATGTAAGDTACAWVSGSTRAGTAGDDGGTRLPVTTPAGTADRVYTVTDSRGRVGQATLRVLGKLTVPFTLKSSVRRGGTQAVVVTRLKPGEKVSVFYRGDKVRTGTANADGRYVARFTATGPRVTRTVRVDGQFRSLRTASKTFKVT